MAMPEWESHASPTACEVRAALEQVVASAGFSKSGQLASFLRFVVTETLAGRGERIKAYTIATAALGRDEHFDPQADPIVRVEAGRLRRALRHYYGREGSGDPVIIDLPVGHYAPVFRRNVEPAHAEAHGRRLGRQLIDTAQQYRTLLLLIAVVAAVVSLSMDMLEMLVSKTIWPMLVHLAESASALWLPSIDNPSR